MRAVVLGFSFHYCFHLSLCLHRDLLNLILDIVHQSQTSSLNVAKVNTFDLNLRMRSVGVPPGLFAHGKI